MSQKQSIPKIKNGIFSELQLVNLYGTDKQKKSYCTNGRFIGGYKKEFLKKLSLYCDITDLGKRTYEIKLREEELPFNIKKMNSSLYQYLVPLVLQYLLEGYSKNNILKTTFVKWAVNLKVINPNYNLVRYNLREASHLFSCEVDLLLDFFIRSDKIINYYFKKALDYLNDSGYIAITEKEKVLKEEIDDKAQIIKSFDGDYNRL